MVPDRQKIKEASTRSWNWVKKKTFNPMPFYKRSWEILRRDMLVFVWKMIADFISRTGTFTVVMFVLSLLIVDFQHFTSLGNSPFSWIDRFAELSQSPGFIAGFVGVAFFTTLLGTSIQAFVVGGIWGLIAAALRGEEVQRWSTFAHHTWIHFPNVLALFLIKLAVRTVTILLAIAMLLGFLRAYASGSIGYWSTPAQVLFATACLAFFIGWFAITRLTVEVIGAPLIIDEMSLGEAILEGAAFVVDNFWAMYRLLIFSLGLLLIPLAGYWVLLMVNNLTLLWPVLAPLGLVLRFLAELFLWFSISFLGVLFYGAIFAFYRRDDAAVEKETASKKKARKRKKAPSRTNTPRQEITSTFENAPALQELLPEESENRFPIEEILPASKEAEESNAQDRPRDPAQNSGASDAGDEDSSPSGSASDGDPDDSSENL